jgi:hypothetical protein
MLASCRQRAQTMLQTTGADTGVGYSHRSLALWRAMHARTYPVLDRDSEGASLRSASARTRLTREGRGIQKIEAANPIRMIIIHQLVCSDLLRTLSFVHYSSRSCCSPSSKSRPLASPEFHSRRTPRSVRVEAAARRPGGVANRGLTRMRLCCGQLAFSPALPVLPRCCRSSSEIACLVPCPARAARSIPPAPPS